MDTSRVLITGGTGFLGSEIVSVLRSKYPDLHIIVLDLPQEAPAKVTSCKVDYFQADITEKKAIKQLFCKVQPDVVVHSAGIVPTRAARYNQQHRRKCFKVNVEGTRNILEAAKVSSVKYLIYTSSYTVISDDADRDFPNMHEEYPVGLAKLVYGETKGIAECYVLDANSSEMLTTAIRPSTLFGPGDYNLVPTIHSCITNGETPFVIGSGMNLYDFGFVTNVADAHVLAIENLFSESPTAAGEAIFIGNGEPIPFRHFCLAVWREFGHYPKWEVQVPRSLAWFAGLISEVVTWMTGREVALCRGSVKDATQTVYADLDKARRVLGYKPKVGIVEGLKIGCKDYQERLATQLK